MDPVIVGVKRFALKDKGLERVAMDALITPMDDKKYERILSSLGSPVTQRITKTPGDIVWWQASLRGGLISPNTPPHLMFGAIKDQYPLTDLKPDGLIKLYQVLRTTPGYLGAWPQPGFLDRLPLGLAPRPDPAGFARMPLGLWRRQFGEFAVLAFDPQVLADVTPRLRVQEGAEPAHIRVEVGDLSKAKLATWVNSVNYERARQASNGNLRLLQTLSQQLGVPKAESRKVAEELLDAKLLCSLGGEYEFKRYANGVEQWRSSKAPGSANYVLPADYKAPLLVWFRGLQSTVIRHQDKLSVHAELDLQRKPGQKPAVKLPLFNLLGKKKSGTAQKASTKKDAQKKDATKNKSGPRRFE